MKAYGKIILYGFISWAVPFFTSFFFFTTKGELRINEFLFKSIMIIVGSLTAAFLLVNYFKTIKSNPRQQGITLGLIWLLINLGLDLLILIPMSGMALDEYFMGIGLRYLVIPVMCISMGLALENQSKEL